MTLKKTALTGACLALLASLPMHASRAAAIDMKALTAPTDKFALHRKDVPQLTVYVWEKDGVTHEAWPGSVEKPPADAVSLKVRIFPFHEGTLREVMYPKGARVPGTTTDDTSSYLLSGHLIQTVGGVAHDMQAGDASFLAAGVKDVKQAVEPSTLLSFHFPTNGAPPVDPVWISGKDLPVATGAEWAEGDENHAALTPEAIAKAPPDAKKFYLKRFKLPRWAIVESHIEKGLTSGWHGGAGTTGMLYVAKGLEIVHYSDGQNEKIGPGDIFLEPNTGKHRTETPEDVLVIRGAVPGETQK